MDFCHINKIHTNEKNIWDLLKSVKLIETDIPNIQTDVTQIKSTIKPWFDIFSRSTKDVYIGNNNTKINFYVSETDGKPDFFVNNVRIGTDSGGESFKYANWFSGDDYSLSIFNRKSGTSINLKAIYGGSYTSSLSLDSYGGQGGCPIATLNTHHSWGDSTFTMGGRSNQTTLNTSLVTINSREYVNNNETGFSIISAGNTQIKGAGQEATEAGTWLNLCNCEDGKEILLSEDGILFKVGGEDILQIDRSGEASVTNSLQVNGDITTGGYLTATKDINAGSGLIVEGHTSLRDTLNVDGVTHIDNNLIVGGGDLEVLGNAEIRYLTTLGSLILDGPATLKNGRVNLGAPLVIGLQEASRKAITINVPLDDNNVMLPQFNVNGRRYFMHSHWFEDSFENESGGYMRVHYPNDERCICTLSNDEWNVSTQNDNDNPTLSSSIGAKSDGTIKLLAINNETSTGDTDPEVKLSASDGSVLINGDKLVIKAPIEAKGDINTDTNISAGNDLSADGTLTVEGETTLNDKLTVSNGGITADGSVNFRDNTTLKYLSVDDSAKFYNELLVTGEDASIKVDNTSAGLYIYGLTTLANSHINVDTDLVVGNSNNGKKINFYVSTDKGLPNFFVNGERFNSYTPIGDETVVVRGNDQLYEIKFSSIFTDSTLATVTNQMYITNESYYYKNAIPHVKLTIVFSDGSSGIDYANGDFFENEIYIPIVGLKRNTDSTNDVWGTYTIDSVLDNLCISDSSLSEVSTALDNAPQDHTRRANYVFTTISTDNRPLSDAIIKTLGNKKINTVLILKADVKGDFEKAATAINDSGNQNIMAYDATGNITEVERTSVMYFDFEIPNGYTIDSENLERF